MNARNRRAWSRSRRGKFGAVRSQAVVSEDQAPVRIGDESAEPFALHDDVVRPPERDERQLLGDAVLDRCVDLLALRRVERSAGRAR